MAGRKGDHALDGGIRHTQGVPHEAKGIAKIGVNVLIALLLFRQMGYHMMDGRMHERTGMLLCLFVAAHHALNGSWHRNLPKGRYSAQRILLTAVDLLLTLAMAAVAVSAVLSAMMGASGGNAENTVVENEAVSIQSAFNHYSWMGDSLSGADAVSTQQIRVTLPDFVAPLGFDAIPACIRAGERVGMEVEREAFASSAGKILVLRR